MPTPSDGGVVAFRRWLDDAGGDAGMPWAEGASLPPAEHSKTRLLDRLHQHTERCPACALALRRLYIAQRVGLAAAGGALGAAVWFPGAAGPATAAVAVAGLAVAATASLVAPLFVFKAYEHAEH